MCHCINFKVNSTLRILKHNVPLAGHLLVSKGCHFSGGVPKGLLKLFRFYP